MTEQTQTPPSSESTPASTSGQAPASPSDEKKHTSLAELPSNGFVDGVYSIINPQIGTTRAGKPYLKGLLRDATGEVPARQWTFDENQFNDIVATGFVWIAGHTQLYNGQVQLILEQIKPVDVTAEQIRELLPTTPHDIDQMFADLVAIMQSMEHPALKGLLDAYLSDDSLMNSFRMAPAAMSLHHAYIGGLLEHTLQLVRMANAMLPFYPALNRDLVLMGLFLHDLGKTVELTWERGFEYTTDGNLVGHVVRGAIVLQFKAAIAAKQSGHKLPPGALRVLQHIIVSHHGQLEHGAAKLPSTPEAIFVSQLDNLDAKTAMGLQAANRGSNIANEAGEFSDRVWALGTRIYRPDPLAGGE